MYTKLIKRNLKFITSIINIWLLLDFKQSNLNFEPSFAEIHDVLGEIWLFGPKFQARNFGKLWTFGGIKFVYKLFIQLINFIGISK